MGEFAPRANPTVAALWAHFGAVGGVGLGFGDGLVARNQKVGFLGGELFAAGGGGRSGGEGGGFGEEF